MSEQLLTYWEEFTEMLFSNMNSLNAVIQQNPANDPMTFQGNIIDAYNKLLELINTPAFEAIENRLCCVKLPPPSPPETEVITTTVIPPSPPSLLLDSFSSFELMSIENKNAVTIFINKLLETVKGTISIDLDFSAVISEEMFSVSNIITQRIVRLLVLFAQSRLNQQVPVQIAAKEAMMGIVQLVNHITLSQRLVSELSTQLVQEKVKTDNIFALENEIKRKKALLSTIDPDVEPDLHYDISSQLSMDYLSLAQVRNNNDSGVMQAKIASLEATVAFLKGKITTGDCEPVKYTLEQLRVENFALNEELNALKQVFVDTNQEKLQLLTQNDALERTNNELSTELDQLKSILYMDDAKARMASQIKALQISHGLLESRLKEADENIKRYESMGITRMDRIMRENKALSEVNKELSKKVIEYEEKNKRLTTETQSLLRDLNLKSNYNDVVTEISELKALILPLQTSNEILKVELDASKAREQTVRTQLSELQQKAGEVETNHKECKSTFEALRMIHDRNTNMITNLSVDNAVANKSLRLTIIQQAKAIESILKAVVDVPVVINEMVDLGALQTKVSAIRTLVNDVSKRKFVENFMLDKLAKDISIMSNMFNQLKSDIAFYNEEISRVLKVRFR